MIFSFIKNMIKNQEDDLESRIAELLVALFRAGWFRRIMNDAEKYEKNEKKLKYRKDKRRKPNRPKLV